MHCRALFPSLSKGLTFIEGQGSTCCVHMKLWDAPRSMNVMPEPPLRSNHQDCDNPRFCTTPHGWQGPRHRAKADCHSPPRKRCDSCGGGGCPRKLYCSSGGLEKHVGRNRLARALAISTDARGRNQQTADTTISPAIIRRVSCSALAPARLIAIASSTPGKTWAGAQVSADRILAA
jgi:hypothetical protein